MKLRDVAGVSLLFCLAGPLLAAPGAFLGVYLSEGGEGDKGALVEEIAPGSPAAKAELSKGDQIVSANGVRTATSKALMELLGKTEPGATLELVVDREGWQKAIKVQLAPRPTAAPAPEPGTTATPQPTPAERGFLGVHFSQGPRGEAVVGSVVEGTPAAAGGLKAGDVIKMIDGQATPDPSSVISQLGTRGPGTTVSLGIERGREALTLKVTLGRRTMETAAPKPKAEPARPAPTPDPKAKKPGYLGVALDDAEGKGPLKVDDVQANSPAERFGLQKGDVIVAVGDLQVKSVEAFAKAMEGKVAGEVVLLKIDRGGGWQHELRVTLSERQ